MAIVPTTGNKVKKLGNGVDLSKVKTEIRIANRPKIEKKVVIFEAFFFLDKKSNQTSC